MMRRSQKSPRFNRGKSFVHCAESVTSQKTTLKSAYELAYFIRFSTEYAKFYGISCKNLVSKLGAFSLARNIQEVFE